MPNHYFRFKQFAIRQEKSAMKINTDAVLLGAWVEIGVAKQILDVGTGTGIIALMMAQRSKSQIDAVEIDEPSAMQAQENVDACKWKERITIHQKSFQLFSSEITKKFDLIVSNPPYFIKSLKSAERARTIARHNELLTHTDLLVGITELLAEDGRFVGIFPYVEGNVFVALASTFGLYCTKRLIVLGKTSGPVKRLLLEFGFKKVTLEENSIAIRNSDGNYTPEYMSLTKDFYLAF